MRLQKYRFFYSCQRHILVVGANTTPALTWLSRSWLMVLVEALLAIISLWMSFATWKRSISNPRTDGLSRLTTCRDSTAVDSNGIAVASDQIKESPRILKWNI